MKVLVVYNPFSRSQKISSNKQLVRDILSKKYNTIDFYESEGIRSITEYIKIHGNSYDHLIVSGGDGTFNEFVNGIYQGNVTTKVSYIPSGTVNDVGSILKLSKNLKKGLEIALTGKVFKMDISIANDYAFAYACAAGKYTSISYDISAKLKKFFGRMAYMIRAFKEMPKESGIKIKATIGDATYENTCYLMLLLSYRQFGGFRFYRKRDIQLNDGLLDFTLVEKRPFFNVIRTILFIFLGDRFAKQITTISANNAIIELDRKVNFNVDGELAFCADRVEVKVLKERLNITVQDK
ncbi:MAG: diacylglycerol/lipid kinase family protein [Anaeroplasmataceae bacterium]